MKIHLEQIKANNTFHEKNSGFVDSGFVKTCDEHVKGYGGDRVEAERDEVYFQFPQINLEKINLEKDLENMCNTSDTTFASGSTSK